MDACELLHPLVPKAAILPGYLNPIGDGNIYTGFADSAVHCLRPLVFGGFLVGEMASDTYHCPASSLPFETQYWNPKFFNSVCRTWFKIAKTAKNKGIISDPFMMA